MAVKSIGVERLKWLYKDVKELTTPEERQLKEQNEWAWKEPDQDVTNDDEAEATVSPAAGEAEADSAAGVAAASGTMDS